jgi:CDP-diacylglycerol--glycerol-3-phosphate 3-phosphatidyltransferase
MTRQIPNALTTLRLVLAAAFFGMLAGYQYEGRGDPLLLNIALVVYLVALLTDFLDGYLARRWNAASDFGRLVDPFVDKILVLGSFVFFAGKNFIIPETVRPFQATYVVKTLTGVAPGIVVILLARELLVTTLRGMREGAGEAFGAVRSGKVKMVVQSATILVILLYVNYRPWLIERGVEAHARLFRDVAIWLTVAVTILSAAPYLRRRTAPLHEDGARQ